MGICTFIFNAKRIGGNAHLLILFFLLISHVSLFASTIDSLEMQLRKADTQSKLDILIQLSKANWTIAPSKGMFYANAAIKLADKLDEPHQKAKALLYGGVNAWFMGGYNEAIEYYQKSLTIACEINDKRLCAYNLNNLGMVNTYLKSYEKAIANYTESLGIVAELNDKIEYAKIQNNIAELNLLLGNYSKALEQHLSVLDVIEKSDERVFLIWLYNDIGTTYKKMNDYNNALHYFGKAWALSSRINNTLGKSQATNFMGEVYLLNKDYGKAKENFFKALTYAQEAKAMDDINEINLNISNLYLATRNYQKSLEYYKLYKQLSDSIINDKKIHTIIEMQARYDLESKEKENRILRKNAEINKLTINKSQNQRTFLIVLLVLSLMLGGVTYNRLAIKKRKNYELSEKQTLINIQKEQLAKALTDQQQLNKALQLQQNEILISQSKLEQMNKTLEETNATKDKFFSIIAHDLRGPIGDIQSLTNLINDNASKFSAEELIHFISALNTAAHGTYSLLENLLTWARAQRNEIAFTPAMYSLNEIIDECIGIFRLKAADKNIELTNKCTELYFGYFDRNMVKTIITNLLNNATKYTSSNGKIEIDVQNTGNWLQVSVSDNGIGIEPEIMESLFRIDSKHSSVKGTDGEQGTGLGLILCKEFISKHGGKIWAESEAGRGATFYFVIAHRS
ncbi:MAG: ATP-binding protein [Bacteroidales bacterium]